jgi:hypothetical protein
MLLGFGQNLELQLLNITEKHEEYDPSKIAFQSLKEAMDWLNG